MRGPQHPKLPRKEFDFRSVWDQIGVEQTLDRRRGFHMAAAIALVELDRADMHAEHRESAMKAVLQMWDYVAADHGENLDVEHNRTSVRIDVVDQ